MPAKWPIIYSDDVSREEKTLVYREPTRCCSVGLPPTSQPPAHMLGSSVFRRHWPYCLTLTLHLLLPLPAKSFHLLSKWFPPSPPAHVDSKVTCSLSPFLITLFKHPPPFNVLAHHLSSSCIVNIVLVYVLPHLRIPALQGQESVSSVHSSFPALLTLWAHQALKSWRNSGGSLHTCVMEAESRNPGPDCLVGSLPPPMSNWVTLGKLLKLSKTQSLHL